MWHMVPQPSEEEPAAFFEQSDSHDLRSGSTFRRIRNLHITCVVEIFWGLFPELWVYPDMFLPGASSASPVVEAAARI